MMQQGLGALVPQQSAGQAPENPVRMAAAMDVVTSDAEEQVLDPRTLALIKYKDAVAAMQAADQLMAASQPTPTPPTVAERTKLAAQQGIMGLASRLAPGLQQQGNRMAQQAAGGGLPQLSAPNMAGMASGGIVGYAGEDGSFVSRDAARRRVEQNRAARELEREEAAAMKARELSNLLGVPAEEFQTPQTFTLSSDGGITPNLPERASDAPAVAAVETPQRRSELSLDSLRPGVAPRMPGGVEQEQPAASAAPTNSARAALQARVASQQGPDLNVGIAAPSATLNAAREELLALSKGRSAENTGARYRELTALEDMMEQRRAEQERLRALREEQFSPEKERSRLLRAALAGGADGGLGGFGRGYTAEEGRITSEKQALQQQVIADMDKTISELRALGVGQFEAEQTAAQIYSTQLQALAELEQNEALADRTSREMSERENRADVRQQAELEQALLIAEMERDLRLETISAEEKAALAQAANDYAEQMRIRPKELLELAVDLAANSMGTLTVSQALEQLYAESETYAPSVIQGIRQVE